MMDDNIIYEEGNPHPVPSSLPRPANDKDIKNYLNAKRGLQLRANELMPEFSELWKGKDVSSLSRSRRKLIGDTIQFDNRIRLETHQRLQFILEILEGDTVSKFNITDDVKSWGEMYTKVGRSDTSGITISYNVPIEFALDAANIVRELFDAYDINAKANLYIYKRDIFKMQYYYLYDVVNLEFSSYSDNGTYVSVGGRQDTMQDLITTKGKSKYDVRVSDVAYPQKWKYDRMAIMVTYPFVFQNIIWVSGTGQVSYDSVHPVVYKSEPETVPGIELQDTQDNEQGNTSYGSWFFRTKELQKDVEVDYSFTMKPNKTGNQQEYFGARIVFYDENGNEILGDVEFGNRNPIYKLDYDVTKHAFEGVYVIPVLPAGYGISIRWWTALPDYPEQESNTATMDVFKHFYVRCFGISSQTYDIDIVKPETLLNHLLDTMSKVPGKYAARIEGLNDAGRPFNTLFLCAAESIRGLPDAKLHTSYQEVEKWLFVFGMEPTYIDNEVVFKRRDKVFDNTKKVLEIPAEIVNGLEISMNTDYLYSRAEIGYKRIDHENVNGRYEFNGTYSYTTGLDNVDKKLDLISPYRGDSYGVEFLCIERSKDDYASTKDLKSDNDIFVVDLIYDEENRFYKTYQIPIGGKVAARFAGHTAFNVMISPYYLAKRNESLIGISSTLLTFTGSDVNSEVTDLEHGVKLGGDIAITTRLMKPATASFAVGDYVNIPDGDDRMGLIEITYRRKKYRGFIDGLTLNPGKRWSIGNWKLHLYEKV